MSGKRCADGHAKARRNLVHYFSDVFVDLCFDTAAATGTWAGVVPCRLARDIRRLVRAH